MARRGAVVRYRGLTGAQVSGRKDIAVTRLHDPDAPDPPVAEFSSSELGAMLRETRLSLGRELEEVAAELRIRLVYLQAIEAGRLDDLPGITYATGFLRAYGDFLGLDGDDLVNRFKSAGLAMSQSPDLHLPSPVEEGRLPTGSVLLVAALLAVGAYGGWYYMSSQGQDPIETVAALPNQLAELVGINGDDRQAASADAPDTAPSDADGRATDGATAAVTDATAGVTDATAQTAIASPGEASNSPAGQAGAIDPAGQSPAGDAAPSTEAPVTTAATPPEAPPPAGTEPNSAETAPAAPVETAATAVPEPPAAPRRKPVSADRAPARNPAPTAAAVADVAAADRAPTAATIVAAATSGEADAAREDGGESAAAAASPPAHRVVLRANTATWVEVGAAEEDPVLSRLMRQGETFVVPSRPGMMMATGNAGAIDILVDGKAIPRLGPIGEIRKNVALDAESLLETTNATR